MRQDSSRWQTAVISAAQKTLAARWRMVTEDWMAARTEYVALLEAENTDISALRKASQRLHDLQAQCGVLSRELQEE